MTPDQKREKLASAVASIPDLMLENAVAVEISMTPQGITVFVSPPCAVETWVESLNIAKPSDH